ncbi:hypothetical protein C2G38_782415 [Gigaspora rosea]|uniref:Uncharacterized protein n=1 Tax=Gigaspora rosea TaxID=44941 RepID=A0A397U7Z5_9GLOM|nr:hypothetical protein C2G38_782415 [Gigaspora rosea]
MSKYFIILNVSLYFNHVVWYEKQFNTKHRHLINYLYNHPKKGMIKFNLCKYLKK